MKSDDESEEDASAAVDAAARAADAPVVADDGVDGVRALGAAYEEGSADDAETTAPPPIEGGDTNTEARAPRAVGDGAMMDAGRAGDAGSLSEADKVDLDAGGTGPMMSPSTYASPPSRLPSGSAAGTGMASCSALIGTGSI